MERVVRSPVPLARANQSAFVRRRCLQRVGCGTLVAALSLVLGCSKPSSSPVQSASNVDLTPSNATEQTPTHQPHPSASVNPWQPDFSRETVIGARRQVTLDRPSQQVFQARCTTDAIKLIRPRVHEVVSLGQWGTLRLWRVTHALGMFRGDYVVRVQCGDQTEGHHVIRFRIDTDYSRDVKDGWGRIEMVNEGSYRTRIAYDVQAVLYAGVVRWLFSSRIEKAMEAVPDRAKAYLLRKLPPPPSTPNR